MKKINVPPFITSSRKDLSLWQSAVATAVHNELRKQDATIKRNSREVFNHPMVLATNYFVSKMENGVKIPTPSLADFAGKTEEEVYNHPVLHGYLSQHVFESPNAPTVNLDSSEGDGSTLPYSDSMISAWVQTALIYTAYVGAEAIFGYPYIDVSTINPAISWQIPEAGKVLILGDYATGLEDAIAFLETMITTYNPVCIIHIGDVYYSGLDTECRANLADVLTAAFQNCGVAPIPFFSIPGNHEYIGGCYTNLGGTGVPIPTSGPGGGYYQNVLPINGNNGLDISTSQQGSFFSLQTADGQWQFVGMDTGFYSTQLGDMLPTSGTAYGPWLHSDEVAWLQAQIANFPGQTILLSHHQLFSADATINGMANRGSTFLNDFLLSYFRPYFNKISAWFWGHEHALGIFQDGLYGLPKGRLVGNSGYEEALSQDPFVINNLLAPYSASMPALGTTPVGTDNVAWYNHVCALVDFGNPAAPQVSYIDFPVWPSEPSDPDQYPQPALTLTTLYTETLATTNPYFIGWNTALPNAGAYDPSDAVTGNGVIYASANGIVSVLDPVTGAVLNSGGNGLQIPNESSELRLMCTDSYLYAGSARGYVYQISLDGNTLVNTCDLPQSGTPVNLIAGTDGYIYAGYHGDAVQLDPNTLSVINTTNLSNWDGEVRLAWYSNTLYAGVDAYYFVFSTGNFNKPVEVNMPPVHATTSIIVVNGYVYLGVSGKVYCYDSSQNLVSTSSLVGGSSEVRVYSDGNYLYAGTNGYISCLNLVSLTSNSNWQTNNLLLQDCGPTPLDNNLRMICNNGYLFIGCYGCLYKIDTTNGYCYPGLNTKQGYHGYEVPIALNGDGICAIFTGSNFVQNYAVDNDYPSGWVSYITCVSQDTLT